MSESILCKRNILRFFILSIISGSFLLFGAGEASAATYYVRADGTVTCDNKANATSPDSAGTSLGVLNSASGVNGCTTFSPGDTIYFSAKGGSYTAVDSAFDSLPTAIYIPQASGTIGNPINYIGLSDNTSTTTLENGVVNNYPLVDVSAVAGGNGVTGGSGGIRVAFVNYITVQNFNIKGSGGAASAAFEIDHASGAAGDGYTNVYTNINVLSNYGASSGNNDCIDGGSGTGETAQGIFNNVYASGCRPDPQAGGSHQCVSFHENAKAQIDGLYCSDSNYGITNTKATQLTATNVTMSNIYLEMIDITANAVAGSYITVSSSTLNIDGAGGFVGIPNGAGATVITVQNSTINATAGKTSFIYGGTVNFINNAWAINSAVFQESAETNGTLNITGANTFALTGAVTTGIFKADQGTPAPILNVSGARFDGGTAGYYLANSSAGTSNITNNIFTNFGGMPSAIWAFFRNGIINARNNTFYNPTATGTSMYIQSTANINNTNNIFYNVATPCAGGNCAATGYTSSYNNYYNYTSLTNPGTGSITSNPNLVNPGTDFSLQTTSPAVDVGTTTAEMTSTTTDYSGNPVYGIPDLGAYEYQPSFTIGTDKLDSTGNIRIYTDGKYRYTTATSGVATADLSAAPNYSWPIYGASTTRSEWLDISGITWGATKEWTASSSNATTTVFTIGDLTPDVPYAVTRDGVVSATITGDNCADGVCTANGSGIITFTYDGGYSAHTFSVALDTTPPLISITSPSSGATASSSITLAASSTDGIAVSGVQFQIDGLNLGSQITSTPSLNTYATTWDTTTVSDSLHTIKAISTDASNNVASTTITITTHNTPPFRSSGSPSGYLIYRTASTTLSLSTDESATCRYSSASGSSFGSMTAFTNTASTTHRTTLPSLISGTQYFYYVKCEDGAGNINSDDYLVTFTVSGALIVSPIGVLPVIDPNVPVLEAPASTQTPQPRVSAPSDPLQPVSPSLSPSLQAPTVVPRRSIRRLFRGYLKLGMTSDEVSNLQTALEEEGFFSGPVTGYFGKMTETAVKQFQEKYDIATPDDPGFGVVGPKTRVVLNNQSSGLIAPNEQIQAMIDLLRQKVLELEMRIEEMLKRR